MDCEFGFGVGRWVKVLILLGFYDIGCDIRIFEMDCWKAGILLGLVGFWIGVLKLSRFVDELAYRLPGK